MTTREISPRPPGTVGPSTYDEWRTRRWRLTGLAFAILWLATAVAFVVVGEKRAELHNLESDIAAGDVRQVEVVGLPDDVDWRGRAAVTLKWHGTVMDRFADVTVDNRRRAGDGQSNGYGNRVVIAGDLEDHLTAISPDYARTDPPAVELIYSEFRNYQEWHGWRAPDVPVVMGLVAWFGTILLAGAGPQTWRATPWAWIWLILFGGPLGSVAFLLLGGPLGLVRPRDPRRRLTGGWAFLIGAVFLGGANAE